MWGSFETNLTSMMPHIKHIRAGPLFVIKGKIKLSLSTSQVMWGNADKVPFILNLTIRWRWSCPLYPKANATRTHLIGGLVAPEYLLNLWNRQKFLASLEIYDMLVQPVV
jgi:hypothetical protein